MSKTSLIGAALLAAALAACASADPALSVARRDDAHCRHFGAVPSTQAYVDCRLALTKQQDEQFRAAATAPPPPDGRSWPWRRTYSPVPLGRN